MSMNDVPEINEGYIIRERFVVGELGFVLGERDTDIARYVTWGFRADSPSDYYWGHYFNNKEAAYGDYQSRIEDEVVHQKLLTGEPPLLPPLCLTVEPSSGDLVNIRRGEMGYCGSNWNRPGERESNRKTADMMNGRWGVSKAQEEAMLCGSMFGWHVPAADPRNYDDQGRPFPSDKAKNHKQHER